MTDKSQPKLAFAPKQIQRDPVQQRSKSELDRDNSKKDEQKPQQKAQFQRPKKQLQYEFTTQQQQNNFYQQQQADQNIELQQSNLPELKDNYPINLPFDSKQKQLILQQQIQQQSVIEDNKMDFLMKNQIYQPIKQQQQEVIDEKQAESQQILTSTQQTVGQTNNIQQIQPQPLQFGNITLLQLPQQLPIRSQISKQESLSNVGNGQIGTIIKYKSGKTKMRLNNGIEYELFQGQKVDFYQQVVSVDAQRKVIQNVGIVDTRVVAALGFDE